MDLRLITAPDAEPVTLAEAKAHLRVDHDAEDMLIAAWIEAARMSVEASTGRALMPQTWEMRLAAFLADAIELPSPPLIAVLSVATVDAAGTITGLHPATYQVIAPAGPMAQPGAIRPAAGECWPGTVAGVAGAVRVQYQAGYANAAAVPAPLRAAILLLVGDLYENREAGAEGSGSSARVLNTNPTVDRLIAPFRIMTL